MTAAMLGKLPEFNPEGGNFEVFLERFETYAAVNNISDDKKKQLFLTIIGEDVYVTLKSLLFPKTPVAASFREASSALKNHYSPRESVISQRYRFNQRKQEPDETVTAFVVAIREIAAQCEFGAFLHDALRDRLVAGLRSEAIRRRLLAMPDEEASWERACRLAKEMEAGNPEDAKYASPKNDFAGPSTSSAKKPLKRPATTVKVETPPPKTAPKPAKPVNQNGSGKQQRQSFSGPNSSRTPGCQPLTGNTDNFNRNNSVIALGYEPPPHTSHGNVEGLPASCLRCNTFYRTFVKLSELAAVMLELNTRNQNSSLWSVARRLRVTSSNVKKIPKKDSTPGGNAVNAIINPNFAGNAATRHGLDYEAVAREQFTKNTGLRVMPAGIFVSTRVPWLAASPDGLVTSANAILEVKCPHVTDCLELIRAGKYDVRLEADNYVLLENGPNGYYRQVQFAMFCTGKKLCYFYVWSARNDIVVEVPFSPDFVDACMPRLRKFYFTELLPELEKQHREGALQICEEYKDLGKL